MHHETLCHGEYGRKRIRRVLGIWRTMMARCNVPQPRNLTEGAVFEYASAGAVLSNSLEDMGRRPSSGHSIERVHNERGYTPLTAFGQLAANSKNKTSTRVYANDRFEGTL